MVVPTRQVEVRQATAEEILPFIKRACAFAPAGVTIDPAEVIAYGTGFIAYENGVPFLGYTLEPDGDELVMTTAAGTSSFDLVRALVILTEVHGAKYRSIRFQTIRRGLVRKASKFGYRVVAHVADVYVMRKENGKQ